MVVGPRRASLLGTAAVGADAWPGGDRSGSRIRPGAARRRAASGRWSRCIGSAAANLRAAFPDADAAWIEATLRGAWENLGRVAGEYVHLGRLWDYDTAHPNTGRIITDDVPLFEELHNDGKPALCFAAHLANWELPAVMAAAHGLPSAVVYRMPNNSAVAREIARIRAPLMGRLIRSRPEAPFEMAAALERGEHLGMLVDQRFSRGVEVTFFGRRCKANPTIARLARQLRLPGGRRAGDPPARSALSHPGRRAARPAARCRRRGGRAGDDAADHFDRGRLDPRASRTMAVVSSPLALMPTGRTASASSAAGHGRRVQLTVLCTGVQFPSASRQAALVALPGPETGASNARHDASRDVRSGDRRPRA